MKSNILLGFIAATLPFGAIYVEAKDKDKGAEEQKELIETFKSEDNRKYTYVVDATKAPELMEWVEEEMMPVVFEWYPKMAEMMDSPGYREHREVKFEFKDDMGGTPAYASGNYVALSIPFMKAQLEKEAKGCVIHELVHVIQNFGLARENRNRTETPGWVTEGLADYVRWFLYEPESEGALLRKHNIENAKYDGSYRISASFIDFVVEEYDEDLLKKLNRAGREGEYEPELWEKWTEKTLDELNEEWLKKNRRLIKRGKQ